MSPCGMCSVWYSGLVHGYSIHIKFFHVACLAVAQNQCKVGGENKLRPVTYDPWKRIGEIFRWGEKTRAHGSLAVSTLSCSCVYTGAVHLSRAGWVTVDRTPGPMRWRPDPTGLPTDRPAIHPWDAEELSVWSAERLALTRIPLPLNDLPWIYKEHVCSMLLFL